MHPTDASEARNRLLPVKPALACQAEPRRRASALMPSLSKRLFGRESSREGGGEGLLLRCSTHPDNTSPLSTRGASRPASGQTGLPQDRPASGQTPQDRPASGQTPQEGKSRADLDAIAELIKELFEHQPLPLLSPAAGFVPAVPGLLRRGRRRVHVKGPLASPPSGRLHAPPLSSSTVLPPAGQGGASRDLRAGQHGCAPQTRNPQLACRASPHFGAC